MEATKLGIDGLCFGLNVMANEQVTANHVLNPYRAELIEKVFESVKELSELRKPLQMLGADISFPKNQDPCIIGSHSTRIRLSRELRVGLKRGPKVSGSYTTAASRLMEFAAGYEQEKAIELAQVEAEKKQD
jgi:hypothetical protein